MRANIHLNPSITTQCTISLLFYSPFFYYHHLTKSEISCRRAHDCAVACSEVTGPAPSQHWNMFGSHVGRQWDYVSVYVICISEHEWHPWSVAIWVSACRPARRLQRYCTEMCLPATFGWFIFRRILVLRIQRKECANILLLFCYKSM